MSRELKFRCWNNCLREYIPEEELLEAFGECIKEDHLYIEQYTRLKDKNGEEIYEGDIVKARWYRAKNARLDTMGEIRFNEGWFYIKDDPDGQDRLGVPIHNCYDIEVIGNIHENGDLLKEWSENEN